MAKFFIQFNLITNSLLNKYDKQKIHSVYDKWPELSKNAYEASYPNFKSQKVDHMVFAGMGGSGTIGDVFEALLSKSNITVEVTKGYSLPKTVNSKSLIVASSVSGNTDETLSILKEAKSTGTKIAAFSSGGKIEEFCTQNNFYYSKIGMIHSPRASLPVYIYGILKALKKILPIKEEIIFESISNLEKTRKIIHSDNLTEENPSLALANWIQQFPLLYYPVGLKASAIRFKNSLQENAKQHVFAEDIIEACHNSIVPWEKPSIMQPILISGVDDHPKTKERWKIMKQYFDLKKTPYQEIKSIRGTILSKIMCLIYQLDYASIYLAVLNKIDPTPVNSIDFIKKKLK